MLECVALLCYIRSTSRAYYHDRLLYRRKKNGFSLPQRPPGRILTVKEEEHHAQKFSCSRPEHVVANERADSVGLQDLEAQAKLKLACVGLSHCHKQESAALGVTKRVLSL